MNLHYTIYFGEKPYFIVSTLDDTLKQLAATAGTIMANQYDANLIKKTIQDIDTGGAKAVIVLTNDVEAAWEGFRSNFTPISAGGGIVFNDENEVLFIFRRGKWDLPKGKLDKGETIETCAQREVMEETGLNRLKMLGIAGYTYHTYKEKKKFILKTTVWFRMKAAGNQALIPQTEEDIEHMEWFGKDKFSKPFSNTFPGIKHIIGQSIF